jgi:hypothetical protein
MIHNNFLPKPYESRQITLLLARDQRILTKYVFGGNNLKKIQLWILILKG